MLLFMLTAMNLVLLSFGYSLWPTLQIDEVCWSRNQYAHVKCDSHRQQNSHGYQDCSYSLEETSHSDDLVEDA